MNSRDCVRATIVGEKPGMCAFWLGMPHEDTWPIYLKHCKKHAGKAINEPHPPLPPD